MRKRQGPGRRAVVAGALLGAWAATASPGRVFAATPPARGALVPRAAGHRIRAAGHQVFVEPLSSADGSVVLWSADAVNRLGHVLGHVTTSDPTIPSTSAVWVDGQITMLAPPVPGAVDCVGVDLDDKGRVVGRFTVQGQADGALWTGGVPRVLDAGMPEAIDDDGRMVVSRTVTGGGGASTSGGSTGGGASTGGDSGCGDCFQENDLYVVDGDAATPITPPPSGVPTNYGTVAMNDQGDVLVWGREWQGSASSGFLWHADGVVADFSGVGGTGSLADLAGLNASGQVVGDYSVPGQPGTHSFLWTGRKITTLPGLGGGGTSVGVLGRQPINDLGDVVGFCDLPSGERRPFLFSRGALTDLGTLGGSTAYPVGVNDNREVAGTSTRVDGSLRAFLWRAGELIELPPPPGYDSSTAELITDQGAVIGSAVVAATHTGSLVRWTVD